MEKENIFLKVEIYMMEIGKIINNMEIVIFILKIEILGKNKNGKMDNL